MAWTVADASLKSVSTPPTSCSQLEYAFTPPPIAAASAAPAAAAAVASPDSAAPAAADIPLRADGTKDVTEDTAALTPPMARPTMEDAPEKARENPDVTAVGSRPTTVEPMPLTRDATPVAIDLKDDPIAVAAFLSGAGVNDATFLRAAESLEVDDAAVS